MATQNDWHFISATSKSENHTPFIWLHGWGQDHRAFNRLLGLMADAGDHTAFDQPGFGQTPMLASGADTKDYADALAAQMRSNNIGPAIFVGHSFGCRVSVQMARYHPDLVKGLIIIAGAGIPRKRSLAAKIKGLRTKAIGKYSYLCDKFFGTSKLDAFRERYGSRDYLAAGELRPTFVKVVSENLTDNAKACRVPALLIYGSNDTETPPDIGESYARAIPNAALEVLDGFDHYDILDRGAYQVESFMRRFIEKNNL